MALLRPTPRLLHLLQPEPRASSASALVTTAGPTALQASEALRRERLAAARQLATQIPGRSFLESAAVLPATARSYRRFTEAFLEWMVSHSLDFACAEELDDHVTNYLGEAFFKGMSSSDAAKTVAGIQHHFPKVQRLGSWQIPRTRRVLKAWAKLAPARQRLPLPWICLCALLGWFLAHGHVDGALHLMVQFRTYMRPGVSDALRASQLVAPAPSAGTSYSLWGFNLYPSELQQPGKTGTLDEAIIYDTEPWVHKLFVILLQRSDPESPLWPLRGAALVELFARAAAHLGLQELAPCRYALRHGGASEDLLQRRRSHLEVKRRGGWRTDASLKRYGKESKLLSELRKVPPSTVEFGRTVDARLQEFFEQPGLVVPLLPPIIGDIPAGRKRGRAT